MAHAHDQGGADRWTPWPARLVWMLGVASFVVLVLFPAGYLLACSWTGMAGVSAGLRGVLAKNSWTLLGRSVALSGSVAVLATVLASVVAVYLWLSPGGWSRRVRWFALLLICVPPFVHAMAWTAALTRAAALLGGVSLIGPDAGFAAAVAVQAMAYLPLLVGMLLLGLEGIDGELIDAAILSRGGGAVLWQVVLPLLSPAVAAGTGLVLVLSLMDYAVPNTFGVTVTSLAVFSEFSDSHDAARAAWVGLPLVVAGMVTLVALQGPIRSLAGGSSTIGTPAAKHLRRSKGLGWLRVAGPVVLGLQVVFPIGMLLSAVRFGTALGAVAGCGRDLAYTSLIAAGAAVISLAPAWAFAHLLARSTVAGRLAWIVATLPLAVPGPMVGIALVRLGTDAGCDWVYPTDAAVALACAMRFSPLLAIILSTRLRRFDAEWIAVAQLLGGSPAATLWHIRVPLMARSLLAGLGLVFALSMSELPATLLVLPPGRSTMAVRIHNYLHYGASSEVAILCLVLLAGTLLAAGVVAYIAVGGGTSKEGAS